jgi:hypothetical protein
VPSKFQEVNMFDYFRVPGTTSVHERKLAAWALFVGERSRGVSSADRAVRPHRGMLPDIDPAAAVPDPNYRPLFRRLIDFVRSAGGQDEELEITPAESLPEAGEAPVGKISVMTYIGGAESRRPAERLSTKESSDVDHTRAA